MSLPVLSRPHRSLGRAEARGGRATCPSSLSGLSDRAGTAAQGPQYRVGCTWLTQAFSFRPQAGRSGLSFLLVIPLQRITKYPLLLQKILENTLPNAQAYAVLQRAASALRDVNANINEYKMRKEVGKDMGCLEDSFMRLLPVAEILSYWLYQQSMVAHVTNAETMWALGRV